MPANDIDCVSINSPILENIITDAGSTDIIEEVHQLPAFPTS